MNLKKTIKEELDDLQWMRDIKSYPTLNQLFDAGEINEGDVLVLRGEVENGITNEMIWANDFTVTINTKKDTLDKTSFNLGPNQEETERAMGISDVFNVSFLNSDGNLEVIKKNDQSTQLTGEINESEDDIDWIKDVDSNTYIPKPNERIRVYNVGDEKAFIRWLGSMSRYYERGYLGDYIEGKVSFVGRDIFSLNIWVKTLDKTITIYFPIFNEEKTESLGIFNTDSKYYGLYLFYESI